MEILSRKKLALRNILFILVVLIFGSFAYVLYATSYSSEYYSYSMLLGPLSKNIYVFALYAIGILLAISLIVLLRNMEISNNTHLLLYIGLALVVFFAKYFFPQYFDSAYFENFYDAGGHMARGKYVTLTGHSSVNVDAYFDVQPAFFWWTAAFINIVYGTPASPQDPIFMFLIKWFDVIILMLYLPIILAFFRIVGLSLKESFLAYGVFLLISLSRFHYSAQVYSYTLYWVILIITLRAFKKGKFSSADLLVGAVVMLSMVFVHQGTTLFTLVSESAILLGILVSPTRLRIESTLNLRRDLFFFVAFLSSSWLIYLSYLTVYTFGNFAQALKSVVMAVVERGLPSIVAEATVRPYEPWTQLVSIKALYMVLLASTVVIVLLIQIFSLNVYEIHRSIAKALLYASFAMIAVVGIIALAFGGAGYIERIPEALGPIIALAILSLGILSKQSHLRILISALMIMLIILGGILYFSGWNFQSIPYSEAAAGNFIVGYGSNVAGIYSKFCVEDLYYAVFPYKLTPECLYVEYWHNDIQAIYYLVGNPQTIIEASNDVVKNFNIIFKSPTASLYIT